MKILGRVFLVCCIFALCRHASAATPFPDWVLQAVAHNLPPYPADTKAVVLLEDKLVTVGSDGRAMERYREVIKILRPQGREYANIVAWFSKDNKLTAFHAWSIGPDGHQYTVKDDQVREEGADETGMLYLDVRAKTVRPPASDPGGIVAFEVERQASNYGTQEQTWDFQNPIPTVHSVFEVDLPAGWKSYNAWLRHDTAQPSEVSANHWRWELNDIPAIDLDGVPMAPSEEALVGRMVIHYAAGDLPTGDQRWAEIGNWYDNLASPRTEAPQEIASKSREVVNGAAGFKLKIQDVAGFMQREIRYVGIEIGIGGLQPHSAADVFRNRYGDCKDKATLLIAMLNAVGVRATWVLVDTHRGFIDPSLPSIRGNHAIAAIEMPAGFSDPDLPASVTARNGRKYLIFDPTDPYTRIGLLSSTLQGSYGILVAGKDSQVIQLPKLAPDAALLERTASFDLNEDGSLKGSVTETRTGAMARYPRRVYNDEGEKEQREYMEHRLQRDFSSFTLDSAAAQNVHEIGKDLVLKYSLTANSYAKPTGDLLLFRPRVLGRNALPFNDKPRVFPIDLNETGIWRDKFDVSLPKGYIVDDLPDPVNLDVGFASYHSEVKADGNTLHYSREYIVKQVDIAADKYPDVQKLMGTITADENNSAVLKKK